MSKRARAARRTALGIAVAALTFGCVTGGVSYGGFEFFTAPAADDPWSRKIGRWQARELAQVIAEPPTPGASTVASGTASPQDAGAGDLRTNYFAFRAEQKRATARAVAQWVQDQAKRHYIPDGAYDHWATLEETLARNGDDCDGLELLTFHFLRDAGFRDDEVFRAIVLRPSDGQHHMVTLWFESAHDPWVIDPTGAMIGGMPRLSEVPEWRPIKVFSDRAEYTVRGPGISRVANAR
jgi:hypothetical protein